MSHAFIHWLARCLCATSLALALFANHAIADEPPRRLLYVATPGVRDLLEFGGHGVLVFDIDDNHRFVRRIPTGGLSDDGRPLNVKGICACASTKRLYLTTLKHVLCLDLTTDKLLWERTYDGGCDRLAINPDGTRLYVPSLEGPHWHFLDAATGDVIAKVTPDSGAHNTICGLSGDKVYLAGLKSPLLSVADAHGDQVLRAVGPFSAEIRPFTVNGEETLCYVNLNQLLGFEVGDLRTGQKLHRVEVEGFKPGPVKRHGCPSHGVGLTPDERELWLTDAHNRRLHIFDATVMPPKQRESIALRDEPGWITFSLDGQYAYPSTGEVIDAKTKKILTQLTDEEGRAVQSEKLLEIDFENSTPTKNSDQFGLGRVKNQ